MMTGINRIVIALNRCKLNELNCEHCGGETTNQQKQLMQWELRTRFATTQFH